VPSFAEAIAIMDTARSKVPKRRKGLVVAETCYCCRCGAEQQFDVCEGVGSFLPAPEVINCNACGQSEMVMRERGIVYIDFPQRRPGYPYLRIPSRRAMLQLAREGKAHAQVVWVE
jgi:hypothetical protein